MGEEMSKNKLTISEKAKIVFVFIWKMWVSEDDIRDRRENDQNPNR